MQFCLGPLCLGTIQTLNIAQKVRLKLSKTHENMCMYQDNLSCLLQGLQRYGMQRRGKFAINTNLQLTIFSLKKYNIFAVTFITIDHTFTISVLIKVTIHITRSSSLAKFIIPLLLSPCYVRNIHIILLSLLLSPWLHSSSFETCLRPKMGLVPRENCPMKTNPGSKTQSGLNNGIFFHSKLPFTTSFPLFLRQKREG